MSINAVGDYTITEVIPIIYYFSKNLFKNNIFIKYKFLWLRLVYTNMWIISVT